MNVKEIRQWGEEVGRKYPVIADLRTNKNQQQVIDEGVHNDNFGLAILQIQATLEVAAQIAELRDALRAHWLVQGER